MREITCAMRFEPGSTGYRPWCNAFVVGCGVLLVAASAASAQSQITPGAPSVALRPQAIANGVGSRITYQYNTEFVTIGAPGNAAWTSPPNVSDYMRGFGSVNYEYRIGRTEITTSQWASFLSAAMGRSSSQRLPWLSIPSSWAGDIDPNYDGPGVHYRAIPGRENFGVGDISWRAAAMYCNWLHNGQSTSRESFLSGAYDVSTFGVRGNVFTDQASRSPDAKFWIPSMSEWMKAAFYDPNQGGAGVGGYWHYSNGTDTPLFYGSPGVGGQANSGFNTAANGVDATQIPLMSYPNTQSPWGLLDMAGGTREWTESTYTYSDGYKDRIILGSAWVAPVSEGTDRIGLTGGAFPADEAFLQGFRIAASIPNPGGMVVMVVGMVCCSVRRKRGAL